MSKFLLKFIAYLSFAALVLSCSNESVQKFDEAPRGIVEKQDRVKDVTLTFEPKVDILFVIDNSGSMSSHQRNLARNVMSFTNQITQNLLLDYHIGVVTSDIEQSAGELIGNPPWVERTTSDRALRLAENMQPGWDGAWQEKFFLPLLIALKPPLVDGVNKGFYRPEAFLAVVFITDAGIKESLSARATFEELLRLKQNDKDKLAAYAAIVPPDNPNSCGTDDQWGGNYLNIFLEFLDYFEGAGLGKNLF